MTSIPGGVSQEQLVELSSALSGFLTVLLVFSTLKSSSLLGLFAYHPICMSIAFLTIATWGIRIAHRARDTDGHARVLALSKHGITQLSAFGLAAVGFMAIYANKAVNGKAHFTSLHGKMGLVTMVLALTVTVLGALGFKKYSPLPVPMHPSIKWAHRGLGVAMWSLALTTIFVVLPHKAVITGLLARGLQAGVAILAVMVVMVLREKGGSSGKGTIIDFTLVPRERSY